MMYSQTSSIMSPYVGTAGSMMFLEPTSTACNPPMSTDRPCACQLPMQIDTYNSFDRLGYSPRMVAAAAASSGAASAAASRASRVASSRCARCCSSYSDVQGSSDNVEDDEAAARATDLRRLGVSDPRYTFAAGRYNVNVSNTSAAISDLGNWLPDPGLYRAQNRGRLRANVQAQDAAAELPDFGSRIRNLFRKKSTKPKRYDVAAQDYNARLPDPGTIAQRKKK